MMDNSSHSRKTILSLIVTGFVCLFFQCLPNLSVADTYVKFENIIFRQVEIPFYQFEEYTPQVSLQMDYARPEMTIEDMHGWLDKSHHIIPYEIDLVFTKYPKDTAEWRTRYSKLLKDRMTNLFALDSSLKHNKNLKWNMYLQTKCTSEDQAKKYFHGFVIKYKPRKVRIIEKIKSPSDFKAMITGHARSRDTSVLSILDRQSWDDMLVVMDWTGSMYKFGVQVIQWHKEQNSRKDQRMSHLVLFNDGNKRNSWQKKVGKTGGVYRSKSVHLDEVIRTMIYVMKKGNGGDAPENDIEAILTGTKYLTNFSEVVLIADNKSKVRDIELLVELEHPIRVVLCGKVDENDLNPDYIKIAKETGGSIHVLEGDIYNFDKLPVPIE